MVDLEESELMSELVYFIYPSCNGTCEHCWSAERSLGRLRPIPWHEKLIQNLSSAGHGYSEIKISGGEPFLHREVGYFPILIHEYFGQELPISIFTSGRPFISFEKGETGIERTCLALKNTIKNFDNCSIQLSVDEFHVNSLSRYFGWQKNDIENNICSYISNFIVACEQIQVEHPLFLGPKLKIHCNKGRLLYHKNELFKWFPSEWWIRYAILTEGLVAAGRGKSLSGTEELREDGPVSYFLLPGVDFYRNPQSKRGVEYHSVVGDSCLYLDDSDNSAVLIEGWWNLINRKAKYQRIIIE